MTTNLTPAQDQVEQDLINRVVESFANTENPRLKEIMQGLVTHLHAFVRDVRLTEEEWNKGIEFLTAVGHITDDKRQEFILLSDVLDVSMQTINVSNEAYKEPPSSAPSSWRTPPEIPIGGDISGGASGEPCWV